MNPLSGTDRSSGGSDRIKPRHGRRALSTIVAVAGCAAMIALLTGPAFPLSGPDDSAQQQTRQRRLRFRLIFTGNTMGYIEPCNCGSGLLGGLDRRSAAIHEARSEDLPTVLFDLGNMFETPVGGPITELGRRQARFLADEMSTMGYDFMAVGFRDLNFSPEFLAEYIPDLKYPPLLTNRADGADIGVETKRKLRLELGELKVDFFNVVEPQNVTRSGLVTRWEELLTEMLNESANGEDPADVQVVIAHVPWTTTEHMPEWYPEIDIIVNGTWLLPRQGFRIRNAVSMTAAGKGQMVAMLDVNNVLPKFYQRDDRPTIAAFQGIHVKLDPGAHHDPELRARMDAFKQQLIRDGLILP